jgi:membrane fusion protein (multidrug efflux system)
MSEPLTPRETKTARRRGLTLIAAAVVVVGVGWGAWDWFSGRHYESTDNAYVAGNVVQITPQVAGTVVAIGADDTDHVQTGQTLVRLDPADARIALDQAQAQLAQTVREVRSLYANNAALQAQISLRSADLARAEAEVARLEDDVRRRAPLMASGAVGKEEFQHANAVVNTAKSSATAARAALLAAKEQLAASQTQTEGTRVQEHPSVQRAAAKVREAFLALQRTELVAPLSGYVAKRGVQVGQRVAAGAPLMTVVELDKLWVDANFKESQLHKLRIGQSVDLVADLYGDKVAYHGTVAGLGAGTGAAFALLPAQNATGNWIKVVQRVPVRIALDAAQVAQHPLRIGLSMDVKVDTDDQSGPMLSTAQRSAPVAATSVYDAQLEAADAAVEKTISANLGREATARASSAVLAAAARTANH